MTNNFRCYGGGQSLRGWGRNRAAMSLEPKEAAKRKNDRQLESKGAQKKPKNHTGKLENVSWDKEALIAEVEAYSSDEEVNWSALARRYNVRNMNDEIAKNGGQIIKEWLKIKGVNVSRFKRKLSSEDDGTANASTRIRRKKRRITGGEVTFPTDVTTEQLKEIARNKIASGEYTIGERIVPRKVNINLLWQNNYKKYL